MPDNVEGEQQLRQLLDKAGVSDLSEIRTAKANLTKFVRALSPEERRSILEVPAFRDVVCDLIGRYIEQAEETARERWRVLQEAAKNGSLTDEQLLDAIKVLAAVDVKRDDSTKELLFKVALIVGGTIIMVITLGKFRPPWGRA